MAEAVRTRTLRWLRRHGYLRDEDSRYDSNETPEPSALDACAQLAMSPGVLGLLDDDGEPQGFAHAERKLGPLSADVGGFNVSEARKTGPLLL